MVLGIDLGTTYSAAAYVDKDGEARIIVNREGDRTTPSVFFEEDRDSIVIGKCAKDNAILRPKDVISTVKNTMGSKCEYITSSGRKYVPEEISSFIIRKMVQDAESYTGEKIRDVVITVPAYFNDAQRKATEDAARIAGVHMVGSINEPTAAILCYAQKHKIEHGNVMIYDLGGGTFDVSIVEINGDDIRVKSTDGIPKTGGAFFDDNIIVTYISNLLLEKHGIDLTSDEYVEDRQEIRLKAEECKIQLSSRKSVTLPIRIGTVKESIEITREYFESKLKPYFNMTRAKMKNALKNAGLTVEELDIVLMVGGSSRIPFIEEKVREFTGKEPARDINPDEAVAIGAAIFGKLHEGEGVQKFFRDTNSHSIGFIYVKADKTRENYILIKKNTALPAQTTQAARTVVPNQERIELSVTEGEGTDIQYVQVLSVLNIPLPPKLPKDTEVIITYQQDEYQMLHIFVNIPSVKDCSFEFEIQREANLTEDDIAAMTGVALSTTVS